MTQAEPKIIIFMGLPGAGKGTQAKFLEKKLEIVSLSTGDMLRAKSKDDDELGRRIKHINDTFSPMPDEIVIDMIRDRISKADCSNGFILDGFPRTLPQAKALDVMLQEQHLKIGKIIVFNIDDQTVIERLSGRLNCPSCKASYHVTHMPPKVEGICDNCGDALFKRDDDTPEKIKIRMDTFKPPMEAIIAYYRENHPVIDVDATQKADKINSELEKLF